MEQPHRIDTSQEPLAGNAASTAATPDPRTTLANEPMHLRQVLAVVVATALNAMDGFDVLSISFAAPGITAGARFPTIGGATAV